MVQKTSESDHCNQICHDMFLFWYIVPSYIHTKWCLLGIKLHFQHAFLHGFEVAYELQEGLNFDVQLADLFLSRSVQFILHLSLLLWMKIIHKHIVDKHIVESSLLKPLSGQLGQSNLLNLTNPHSKYNSATLNVLCKDLWTLHWLTYLEHIFVCELGML